MSFLAPLFLLGALGVALPVVFHLIRRSSRERIPFSSLMFLQPTPPRVTRRSKLENVFLLILRCIVIGLLALAFARPFLSKSMPPDPNARAGQKLVLLLDTSASMRRGNLWSQAKDKAKAVLRGTSLADQVACYTFDQGMHPVVSFEQWTTLPAQDRIALVSKKLDETNPGWGSTRLGPALVSASELFEARGKEESGQRKIILITDLQEGSHLDGLQGFEWPHGLAVAIEVVKPSRPSNAGLQIASEKADSEKPSQEAGTRVRVSNSSDSQREQFQVGWRSATSQAFIGQTMDTYVPPGQSRVLNVPRPSGDGSADRLVLTGDDADFDNTLFIVPPKVEHTQVLYIGPSDEKDASHPLYYLRRAFQQTRRLDVELTAHDPKASLTGTNLTGVRLILVNDALSADQARAVRSFLNADRAVLLTLQDRGMAGTLEELSGMKGLSVEDAPTGNYAMLAHIDFQHPLFAPFADPRYSDFTKIHFWKHRRVALDKVPGSRILAEFDDGSPALAEIPVEKGRLWVLTSGWQQDDSQLALSSKFVPLLYAMLEQSGGIKDARGHYFIGESVPYPAESESVTVRKPDTSEVKWVKGSAFTGTDQPGIYTVSSMQPPMSFAVNVLPEESKTAPLALEAFERLGVPLHDPTAPTARQFQQRREHLQAVQLESRQKLWRWLIVATLVILVMETWLAGRITRQTLGAVPES